MARQLHPENLKPQKKGEPSHNPNGRPKGSRSLAVILRKVMDQNMPMANNPITKELVKGGKITVRDAFILSQLAHALKGNQSAAKEIWERIDGKIDQTLKLETGNAVMDIVPPDAISP